LLAALLSGCVQTVGIGPRAELAVLKQELVKDSAGTPTVLVTVKNVSGVTAELAEVKVRFYDAKKNLIDGMTDSVLNLKPNGTWDFTFTCSGERCSEVKSYETEVTAGTSAGGF
jgi:hypothetical protein